MPINKYRYALEVFKNDGTSIGQVPISMDWEPAIEWTWLLGLRRNQIQPTDSTSASLIQPFWHSQFGEPYINGFGVEIRSANSTGPKTEDFCFDFTTAYFKDEAQAASALLVEKGLLEKGELFLYIPVAFPAPEEPKAGPQLSFRTQKIVPPLPLKESSLERFQNGARSVGTLQPDDMPVFIPQHVLDETGCLSREAGENETGGILIGHLHRDTQVPEVFVEITAQLPAKHVVAKTHTFTFTSHTWTAAQAALDLRKKHEMYLGWWHSHPIREWCKNCPQEKKEACTLTGCFFSGQDLQLHRTVFPRAYSIALVVNDVSSKNMTHSLFGWRNGFMESRGFQIVEKARTARVSKTPTTRSSAGGKQNAT